LLISALQIEDIYKKAHQAIRKDPTQKKAVPKKTAPAKKRWNAKKLTNEERKIKVAAHKAAYVAKLQSETEA